MYLKGRFQDIITVPIPVEVCNAMYTYNVSAETHKELKRITRVHSVRIFSLPSTIFGNTKRLYTNDLLT